MLIKAGTYRFNDVLVPYARPNTLYLGIPLVFECRTSGLIAYCEGVYVSQPDTTFQVSYMIKYTEPDYISDIGILVYEEGVWDKYGVGLGEGVKTIRIRTDSEVPDEFYEWFAANTVETSKQVCGVWKLNAELTALPFDTFKLGYYTTSYEPMITDHGADIVPVEVQGITVYRFSLANTFGDGYENGVPTVLYPAIVAYVNYGGTMMNIFVETGMFANRIADFGTEPQSVSVEFYNWLTANATELVDISGKWRFREVLTPPADAFKETVSFLNGGDSFNAMYAKTVADTTGFGLEFSSVTASGGEILLSYADGAYGDLLAVSGWVDGGYRTVDFGTESQAVSAEFYNWLTGNAVQSNGSLLYRGETIAELFPGQTVTLKCGGMRMEDDVVVRV